MANAELPYDTSINNSTREGTTLAIALDPTASPLVYVAPPALNNIGGWKPTTTATRTPLFTQSGTARDQVTTRVAGAKQTFQTTAPAGNATIQAMMNKALGIGDYAGGAKGGRSVMVRYTANDGLEWQGQGVLVYDGEQGDTPEATRMYAFGIEWQTFIPVYPS